jgi:hypothetical protein
MLLLGDLPDSRVGWQVPVQRVLDQLSLDEYLIVHHCRRHTQDHFGAVGDREHVSGWFPVKLALVGEGRSGVSGKYGLSSGDEPQTP